MSYNKVYKLEATLMRGGTSKGLFFRQDVLPKDEKLRDALFLRAVGSPDPYKKQIDGVGGATSSTSKVVVVGQSTQKNCDVDYLFGAVSIEKNLIDYSGNCGNLVSAVGPFAILEGLVDIKEPVTTVRIWQVNTQKLIIAHVPVENGEPKILGDYQMDGVSFKGEAIQLDFLDPGGSQCDELLPTGNVVDTLEIPNFGTIEATLIDAGNPTVIIRACDLDLPSPEFAKELDNNTDKMALLEKIRAYGAVKMGLAQTPEEATEKRPATPKIAWVMSPQNYTTSSGFALKAEQLDVLACILSMGKVHHAFTGTGSISLAVASALPNSIVSQTLGKTLNNKAICLGHPSGTLEVGATVEFQNNRWISPKAFMLRSARPLMQGTVIIPMA